MRMAGLAILIVGLAGPAPVMAQRLSDYVGWWALQVDGRNLFVLQLEPDAGGRSLRAALTRPRHLSINPADGSASEVSADLIQETATGVVVARNALHLVLQNPDHPKDADAFDFSLVGADAAGLAFSGAPMAPLSMVRAPTGAKVATDWDVERVYARGDRRSTNAEMTALFDADQADRRDVSHVDWTVVSRTDATRRQQVRALLGRGDLHTGADFLHAAFVFQHGERPDDFLLAHTLAMVAVKKGRTDAIWIAAATLDRYLQTIGRAQIYGTQFQVPDATGVATQAPFERDLISDAIRAELDVPTLDQQQSQRAGYDTPPGKH